MSMWIFDAPRQNSSSFARDPIVPARADGHDAIARVDGLVGVGGAVHPEHAEMERMGFVRGALAEQCVDDGCTKFFSQSNDRFAGAGDDGTVADVENRPSRRHSESQPLAGWPRDRRSSGPCSRAGRCRRRRGHRKGPA